MDCAHCLYYREKMENMNDNRVEICNVLTVLLMVSKGIYFTIELELNCFARFLQGPFEVGFPIIGNSGITDMMLDMAHSNSEIDQVSHFLKQ